MPFSDAGKLLPNCLIDLTPTWDGQQSFTINCSRATPGKTSESSLGYAQSAAVRGAGMMAAHGCMVAWPKGCLCMGAKTPSLWKTNISPLKGNSHCKHEGTQVPHPFLDWGSTLCWKEAMGCFHLFILYKEAGEKNFRAVCGGSNSLEKCTAVGMSIEDW